MQFPEGQAGEQGGRGSLMSRYRGTPLDPDAEDQAPPPRDDPAGPGSGAGQASGPGDSPWRQSSWTPAPPVRPVPPPPPAPPRPAASSSVLPAPAPPVEDAAGSAEAETSAVTAPPPEAGGGPARPTDGAATGAAGGTTSRPADRAPTGPRDDTPAEPAGRTPGGTGAGALDRPATTPAGTASRGTTPGGTAGGLLTAERATQFRQRWRDLQADFVDDPRQAVRGAGDLSREILQALSDTIADAERVDSWKAGDGTSATEDLRIALRDYRTLVNRLLEL